MRFLFLIVFITFNSILINAQRTLKVGFNFSPDFCYRTLKVDSTADYLDDLKKIRNDNETPKLSFTTGINLLYEIDEKFSFEAGLSYSEKGEQSKVSALFLGSQVDPIFGMQGNPDFIITKYSYNYIELPLRIIYTYGEKKIKFTSSLGIVPQYLLNATQKFIFLRNNDKVIQNRTKQPYSFNKFNISPTLSFGIDYTINEQFNLKIEPTFRYGILKIIDAPLTSYLWNAGLNMGFYYTIKN